MTSDPKARTQLQSAHDIIQINALNVQCQHNIENCKTCSLARLKNSPTSHRTRQRWSGPLYEVSVTSLWTAATFVSSNGNTATRLVQHSLRNTDFTDTNESQTSVSRNTTVCQFHSAHLHCTALHCAVVIHKQILRNITILNRLFFSTLQKRYQIMSRSSS